MHLRSWEGSSRKPRLFLWLRLWLLTPGFQLMVLVRLQRGLTRIPLLGPVIGPALRRILWYISTIWFGCDISTNARIGPGLYLPHPIGIVIGGDVRLGAGVTILQNVTLGRRDLTQSGSPTIGDGAEIAAGAVIAGPVTIGNDAKIGANSVVLHDVPAGRVAVGVPARVLDA
ncbi:hypothetical protein HOY34_14045 [Xinfangfangia sp. D13-10-4-6]|nr:hypothetical protein [Pseudogemmobacter hezensis]